MAANIAAKANATKATTAHGRLRPSNRRLSGTSPRAVSMAAATLSTSSVTKGGASLRDGAKNPIAAPVTKIAAAPMSNKPPARPWAFPARFATPKTNSSRRLFNWPGHHSQGRVREECWALRLLAGRPRYPLFLEYLVRFMLAQVLGSKSGIRKC